MSYIITIQIAARNARTLRWLANQRRELIDIMREYYADYNGCPISKICENFTSNAELSWVYDQFGSEIEEFSRLSNSRKITTYPAPILGIESKSKDQI